MPNSAGQHSFARAIAHSLFCPKPDEPSRDPNPAVTGWGDIYGDDVVRCRDDRLAHPRSEILSKATAPRLRGEELGARPTARPPEIGGAVPFAAPLEPLRRRTTKRRSRGGPSDGFERPSAYGLSLATTVAPPQHRPGAVLNRPGGRFQPASGPVSAGLDTRPRTPALTRCSAGSAADRLMHSVARRSRRETCIWEILMRAAISDCERS